MKYIIFALVLLIVRGSLEMHNFNAKGHTTAINQINSTMIMTGSEGGWLRLYTIKGQLLREEYFHKNRIVCIQSNMNLLISADMNGLVAFWNKNMQVQKFININKPILSIYSIGSQTLAINTGSQILFYDILNLTFLKSINANGKCIKIKFTKNNNIFCLMQNGQNTSILFYNPQKDQFNQIAIRQQKIIDFAIDQLNQTYFLYVICSKGHLNIYQLDAYRQIKKQNLNKQNPMFSSNYTSLLYFQNQRDLPMFTTVKQGGKIQIFVGFQILMFLQFNLQIKLIQSTIQNVLVLVSTNDRVTIITMKDTEQSQDIWIILLILLLLAVSLYLCLSDCCPGIYDKWQQNRQRKQIEMALYKQKSQLDNF